MPCPWLTVAVVKCPEFGRLFLDLTGRGTLMIKTHERTILLSVRDTTHLTSDPLLCNGSSKQVRGAVGGGGVVREHQGRGGDLPEGSAGTAQSTFLPISPLYHMPMRILMVGQTPTP